MIRLAAILLLILPLMFPLRAAAHALDPGYLELSALGGDRWRATWRVPDVSGHPMPLDARLPGSCSPAGFPSPAFDGRAWSAVQIVSCPGGIAGGTLRIDGLERTATDTLVRYELSPGVPQTRRLTAAEPEFRIDAAPGWSGILASYAALGTVHILEGADHLLFVLALVLLVRAPRRLLWAVTAFTAAHSLTLAAASLGWLTLPSAPVEAVIALSIVFLAWELALPPDRRDPLAERFPALVAFGFGLVHGLGFAGALREIGLPQGDVPLALFAFNIGVEAGQLLFIGTVLLAGLAARRLLPMLAARREIFARAASYAVGSTAAFWAIQRICSF
ncbi:HupE/UreJ family protein [Mangrovicoccus sp. HB161399]|uniref:HupE/UreJ family protein n=1 Tax=Mangrovicoccus sp. HB161399 TaxID=2720392 RepID=UPI001554AF88|nr:HupE/UreJ family protein [Mangrovicoccus sp. HB161399]